MKEKGKKKLVILYSIIIILIIAIIIMLSVILKTYKKFIDLSGKKWIFDLKYSSICNIVFNTT